MQFFIPSVNILGLNYLLYAD